MFFVFFSAQFQKLNTIFRNYALAEAPPSYRLFLPIALLALSCAQEETGGNTITETPANDILVSV